MSRSPKLLLAALLFGVSVCGFAEEKRVISTVEAPEAIGPYSQAIQAGNVMYLSGQIPIDPKTKQLMAKASIEDQTKLVLENLRAVLKAGGMDMGNVVSSTVFMTNLDDFAKMNAVYGSFFPSNAPARATVQVSRLPRDVQVEISVIAVK